MLTEIGDKSRVPQFVKHVKNGEGLLWGFGHRIYKSYDPRAAIIKRTADEVFEMTGRNPLLEIALELERIALEDEYFIERKLYPNVDFYSGIIYQALGFPVDMFPVLFAIPRTVGWLAQWREMIEDAEQKIARPRQVFVGPERRAYVPLERSITVAVGDRYQVCSAWSVLEQKNEEQENDQYQDYRADSDVHLDSSFSICASTPILYLREGIRRQFTPVNNDNEITNRHHRRIRWRRACPR